MNDEDLERLLRQYAPVSPSDDLRDRVLMAPVDPRRAWPWLVAASVLLAVIVGAQISSLRAYGELARRLHPETVDPEVTALEEALGGGPEARRRVEQLLFDQALDRAREASERPVGTAGTSYE